EERQVEPNHVADERRVLAKTSERVVARGRVSGYPLLPVGEIDRFRVGHGSGFWHALRMARAALACAFAALIAAVGCGSNSPNALTRPASHSAARVPAQRRHER